MFKKNMRNCGKEALVLVMEIAFSLTVSTSRRLFILRLAHAKACQHNLGPLSVG